MYSYLLAITLDPCCWFLFFKKIYLLGLRFSVNLFKNILHLALRYQSAFVLRLSYKLILLSSSIACIWFYYTILPVVITTEVLCARYFLLLDLFTRLLPLRRHLVIRWWFYFYSFFLSYFVGIFSSSFFWIRLNWFCLCHVCLSCL